MSDFRFSPRPNKADRISWRPWSEEAFEEAREADKPVLLAISAVWCHWCHVMDETTYSDEANIRFINDSFVAIRVDNDRRPDVNARYNMGGWPTTAFLTPEGDVLTGGTYIPPGQFNAAMVQVADIYKRQKETLYRDLAEKRQKGAQQEQPSRSGATVGNFIIDEVAQAVAGRYDPVHGGFGREPKFPQAEAIELLLLKYQASGEEFFLKMALSTLDAMARGGIFDQVEGGFFRYSTTRDWSVPHYEKMLEDNAALLRSYLHAYLITGRESYKETALKIIGYVDGNLRDPRTGAFYGTQDADEGYYSTDAQGRKGLPKPFIDTTVYTNWCAAMASAYLEASWVLDRPDCMDKALQAIRFILGNCLDEANGLLHYHDGAPHVTGILSDHVHLARALLDAHDLTGDGAYLAQAAEVARRMVESFAAPGGGFFDVPTAHEAMGNLKVKDRPIAENAVAAEVLTRLADATGDETGRKVAGETLQVYLGEYPRLGEFASGYARAVARFANPPLGLTVVGSRDSAQTTALLRAAVMARHPAKSIRVVDPTNRARLDALGYSPSGEPALYVCLGKTCLAPITDPSAVAGLIESAAAGRPASPQDAGW